MLVKRTISILLIITIVFFLWMGQEQRRFMEYGNVEMHGLPHIGHLAPDFTLDNLLTPHETIQLSSTINNSQQGTVIYFWTSWCPFCASSMEALQRAHATYENEITFLGVNVTSQDSKEAAEQFIKDHDIEFLNVSDVNGRVSSAYFVPPVPATLFIDKEGFIVHRKVGALTYQEITQTISQLGRGSE
ncbi:peroxiredoxin [Evansella vedderi]|uniref:Peroxiredoxin n=1 Tax=Evansella vedderi TaxID=38282 RepID=A0ABT9ZQU8_9BACI|nr:TlpA disulfide reductase family protein [Evansella vedderi]MDQ0253605.1 peroxiredoxin [Evansella vedderi]